MTEPSPRESFVDDLLAQDVTGNDGTDVAANDLAQNTEQIDHFKQELQAMMTRPIRPAQRMFFYVLSLVLLVAGGLVASLLMTESLPPAAQVGLGLTVVFSGIWSWKVFSMARRGEIRLKTDNRQIANMVWFFTIIMAVLMLMAAGFKEDLSNRKLILITGQALLFLIAAATYLITQRMEEVELNSRERLLQVQLRLEEIASRQ